MKLLISFNMLDIEQALTTAALVEPHASMFTIGPLLIYKYGEQAVKRFREAFPKKTLIVEAQLLERPQETVTLFSKAGADWISVMAGSDKRTIHTACATARNEKTKIVIDLADASSVGQSALEAKSLGAEALSFHKPSVEEGRVPFIDRWHMVKGNTTLPIFISAHISRENVGEVLGLEPSGIIIGSSIVNANDPLAEATYFADLLKN